MQYARIAIASVLIAALAGGAAAAQDITQARQPALDGWLKAAYGNHARWSARWASTITRDGTELAVERYLCADSGALADGDRHVAVCADVQDASAVDAGLVDLWWLRSDRGAIRMIAKSEGIEAGSMGTAGTVQLLRIGATAWAFDIESGSTGQGTTASRDLVHIARDGRITDAFAYPSGLFGGGDCDADDARCLRNAPEVACGLKADARTTTDGLYRLHVVASGRLRGKPVKRDFPITRKDGRWIVPERAMLAAGCGEAE